MSSKKDVQTYTSIVDPLYSSGEFFKTSQGHLDAEYKVQQLKRILMRHPSALPRNVSRVADVGCGTGDTTRLLPYLFRSLGHESVRITGYDVHPAIAQMPEENGVSFIYGDFCLLNHENFDLVVLLDVIEHIPDPINYLRTIAKYTDLVLFHIPLDHSLLSSIRNLYRQKLNHPGHLIVLNVVTALNLITFSGLRVLDYIYSPVFRAPSGRVTRSQQTLLPLREMLFRTSPHILQSLIGGVGLTVLARSLKQGEANEG